MESNNDVQLAQAIVDLSQADPQAWTIYRQKINERRDHAYAAQIPPIADNRDHGAGRLFELTWLINSFASAARITHDVAVAERGKLRGVD